MQGRRSIIKQENTELPNDNIEITPSYNYLGITLDNQLNLKKQIGITRRNSEHKLFIFRRNSPNLPEKAKLDVVKTMLLPIMDYGDIIYSVAPCTVVDTLQPVLSNALRTVYWRKGTKNHEKLHKLADLNLLKHRREMHLLKHAFDSSLCDDKIDKRPLRTRAHDARLLKVSRVHNPIYRKSLSHRDAILWNQLKVPTRLLRTSTGFNAWLKKEYDKKIKSLPDV